MNKHDERFLNEAEKDLGIKVDRDIIMLMERRDSIARKKKRLFTTSIIVTIISTIPMMMLFLRSHILGIAAFPAVVSIALLFDVLYDVPRGQSNSKKLLKVIFALLGLVATSIIISKSSFTDLKNLPKTFALLAIPLILVSVGEYLYLTQRNLIHEIMELQLQITKREAEIAMSLRESENGSS